MVRYFSWSGWLLGTAQLLTRVASKKSASILERLVQRCSCVFSIVDTMKQADHLQKLRRWCHKVEYLQKLCRQYHEVYFLQKPALMLYVLYRPLQYACRLLLASLVRTVTYGVWLHEHQYLAQGSYGQHVQWRYNLPDVPGQSESGDQRPTARTRSASQETQALLSVSTPTSPLASATAQAAPVGRA